MRLRIKQFRQTHGLFQSDMAQLLKINQSNVSRAELKGYLTLTYPQLEALYDKFGKEDVDSYMIDNAVSIENNTNKGDGIQNNGFFETDTLSLSIIKQQTDILAKMAEKQVEQTDRLIMLLEKLAEKI